MSLKQTTLNSNLNNPLLQNLLTHGNKDNKRKRTHKFNKSFQTNCNPSSDHLCVDSLCNLDLCSFILFKCIKNCLKSFLLSYMSSKYQQTLIQPISSVFLPLPLSFIFHFSFKMLLSLYSFYHLYQLKSLFVHFFINSSPHIDFFGKMLYMIDVHNQPLNSFS